MKSSLSKKITSIAVAVIAIIVIILGVTLRFDASGYYHSAGYYDAESAAFGADFYSYIYEATDIIVDELYEINQGVAEMVSAQSAALQGFEAVVKGCRLIVIAIGLALLAYDLPKLAEVFSGGKKAPAAPVYQQYDPQAYAPQYDPQAYAPQYDPQAYAAPQPEQPVYYDPQAYAAPQQGNYPPQQ